MNFNRSRFGLAVVAGVISTGIYAVVIAFANVVLKQHWPLTAWAAILIMALTMLGALALQYEERRRLEAKLAKWDGVEEATGLCEFKEELAVSDEHPREQLHRIKFSLDFMGNGGSKWTKQEEQLRDALVRVGNAGKKARMLLLHPDSGVCISASESRYESPSVLPMRIVRSLKVLDRLRADFPHLDFRLYNHTPFFRLTFVDERAAIVGHYKQYRADSAYSPLMVWEAERSDWSFYLAFSKYFDAEWENGDELTTGELQLLEERIKNL